VSLPAAVLVASSLVIGGDAPPPAAITAASVVVARPLEPGEGVIQPSRPLPQAPAGPVFFYSPAPDPFRSGGRCGPGG
jgi:hypothetical protein